MKKYYTYILSGKSYGPIYIGSAQDIAARILRHKRGRLSVDAFRIDQLVYIEVHNSEHTASLRALALKKASRQWIDALVEKSNPGWIDLSVEPAKRLRKAA